MLLPLAVHIDSVNDGEILAQKNKKNPLQSSKFRLNFRVAKPAWSRIIPMSGLLGG